MATNREVFEFLIKPVTEVKDISSAVSQFQKLINSIKIPQVLKTQFVKTFANIESSIDKAESTMATGFKTQGSVDKFAMAMERVNTLLVNYHASLGKISPEMLRESFTVDPEIVDNLKNSIEALRAAFSERIEVVGIENVTAAAAELSKISKAKSIEGFSEAIKAGDFDGAAKALENLRMGLAKVLDPQKQEQYAKAVGEMEAAFAKLTEDQTIQTLSSQLETAEHSLRSVTDVEFEKFAAEIERIIKELFPEFAHQAVQLGANLGESAQKSSDFAQSLKQFKDKLTYFFGINNAVLLLQRSLRAAYETIQDLDKVMTETAVVTKFDIGDMWAQLPEYTNRANELGVSIRSAYESATIYYQQGLKNNEVMALSNETLKVARIAGLDAATATDRMTNALRGFNMEMSNTNSIRIADVYSKLAAISAANVDEISTAMTKVASLAHSANMQFETTAAFLTQIIESTRESAETAGTALKTVVARFSEVKSLYSKGELLGLDTEGAEIDVNRVGEALRSAGINLNEYLTGAIGLDEIFLKLASKWSSLDIVQQRYIATMAAGSRQQSRFLAMMSDYARTSELVQAANSANGAANEQFEKTLNSLQTKLTQLKNAWDEFLMGITNHEAIKFLVGLLTNLIGAVNAATKQLPGFTNGLGKLLIMFGAFKIGKKILESLFGTFGDILKKGLGKKVDDSGEKAGYAWGKKFKEAVSAKLDEFEFELSTRGAFAEASKTVPTEENARIQVIYESEGYEAAVAELTKTKEAAAAFNAEQEKSVEKAKKAGPRIATGLSVAVAGFSLLTAQLEKSGAVSQEWIDGLKTLIGVLAAAIPIITLFGKTAVGQALLMQAAWWQVTLVIGMIAAVIGVIVVAWKSFQKSTPEGKLKAAEEATKKAGEEADRTREAYLGLKDALDSIGEKQKNLDGLVKGTAEWKTAVGELNKEIRDLIKDNPDISFEFGSDGVLRITGGKEVLESAKEKAEKAEFTKAGTEIIKKEREKEVLESEYQENKAGQKQTITRIENYMENHVKTREKELYQVVLDGEKEKLEEIEKDFKNKEDKTKDKIKGQIATASSLLIENSDIPDEQKQAALSYVTEMVAKDDFSSILSKKVTADDKEKYAQAKGYESYEELKKKEGAASKDDIRGFLIGEAQRKSAEGYLENFNKISGSAQYLRLFEKEGGAALTRQDIEELRNSSDFDLRRSVINEEVFNEILNSAGQMRDDLKKKFESIGLEEFFEKVPGLNLSIEEEHNLFKNLGKIGDQENRKEISNIISDTLGKAGEDKDEVAKLLSTIDFTQDSDIKALIKSLDDLGIETTGLYNKFYDLGDAAKNVNLKALINQIKSLDQILYDNARGKQGLMFSDEQKKALIDSGLFEEDEFRKSLESGKFAFTGTEKEISGRMEKAYKKIDDAHKRQIADDQNLTKYEKDLLTKQYKESLLSRVPVIQTSGLSGLVDSVGEKEISKELIARAREFGVGEGLIGEFLLGEEGIEGFSEVIEKFENAVREGFNVEQVNDFVEHLKVINPNLTNAEASLAAIANIRFNKGAKDLLDIGKEVENLIDPEIGILSITSSFDSEVFAKSKSALTLMLGLSSDLSKEFYQSAENMQLLREAANGSIVAMQKLRTLQAVEEAHKKQDKMAMSSDEAEFIEYLANLGLEVGVELSKDLLEMFNGVIYEITDEALEAIGIIKREGKFISTGVFSRNELEKLFEKPKTWLNPYDELYNLTKKITEEMRTQQKLQREYQRILDNRSSSLKDLQKQYTDETNSLRQQADYQRQLLEGRKRQIANIGSTKFETEDGGITTLAALGVLRYASYDTQSGLLNIDWNAIDANRNDQMGRAIDKYISELEKLVGSLKETEDALEIIADTEKELQRRSVEAFLDLENRVYSSIINREEKIIENFETLSNAIESSNSKVLSSLQESVALSRQIRDNTKTEEDITNKEKRLAYLQRDTSGANQFEILQLQKEIDEARETYQDTLIDQAIDQLSKDNDLAVEQRATQIEVMNAQLQIAKDNGLFWTETGKVITDSIGADGRLRENSELVRLLENSEAFKGMSEFGKTKWIEDLISAWKKGLERYGDQSNITSTPPSATGAPEASNSTKQEISASVIQKVAGAVWAGGWGIGQDRYNKLTEVFGSSAAQKIQAEVNKGTPAYDPDYLNFSYATARSVDWKKFKTGGLADYTGPAWLDGSRSAPELVLNSIDTRNFLALKDVLAQIFSGARNASSGDNYYDINIDADISSDYDVDQLAKRIKRIIAEDGMYRNVNNINWIR